MTTLTEVLAYLRHIAPEDSALPDDPVGLLIGGAGPTAEISRIGVCLDATPETVQKAAARGVSLVVVHHPLIYQPLKRLDAASDPIARAVSTLVKADVSLYAMHTNWDRADGGINDTLARLLGLRNIRRLGEHGESTLLRLGELAAPMPLSEFTQQVGTVLACGGTSALRINTVDSTRLISRIAVCGGAGASLAAAVQEAGAEIYVTSDVRHHEFLDATGRGLVLLDAGHQATETPGMRALMHLLAEHFPSVEVLWVGP